MSANASTNDIVDNITLASISSASLSPALLDYVSTLLMQEDNQGLYQVWHIISRNPGIDRRSCILQAFGYNEPGQAFDVFFKGFVQQLLLAVWRRDHQTAFTLANTLCAVEPATEDNPPQTLTRLDVILMNDAMINARTIPRRNEGVPQTYVDKYGLPADSGKGKEGRDYFFHDTDEANCKLAFLREYFAGDIVRWVEQDWKDGLYGDPSDWSSSGTNTGWVIQRTKRENQHAKDSQTTSSRSRPAGSYVEQKQIESLGDNQQNLHNLPDQDTNNDYGFPLADPAGPQPPYVQQLDPAQQESPLITRNQHERAATTDRSSAEILTVIPTMPSQAWTTHTFELKRLSEPAELSLHDQQVLESYRRDFEAREEEFRTQRQERAKAKRLIRTKSEEELLRNQSSGV